MTVRVVVSFVRKGAQPALDTATFIVGDTSITFNFLARKREIEITQGENRLIIENLLFHIPFSQIVYFYGPLFADLRRSDDVRERESRGIRYKIIVDE